MLRDTRTDNSFKGERSSIKKNSLCRKFPFPCDGRLRLNNQFHGSMLLQKKKLPRLQARKSNMNLSAHAATAPFPGPTSRCLMSLLKSHLPQALENLIATRELSLTTPVGGLRHLRHLSQSKQPHRELFHQANSFYLIRKTSDQTLILASGNLISLFQHVRLEFLWIQSRALYFETLFVENRKNFLRTSEQTRFLELSPETGGRVKNIILEGI